MPRRAREVAAFLEHHPGVERVLYPGLESHPQHALARRQMASGGGLVAFRVGGGQARAFDVLNRLRLIGISNNLGDAKSLITHPTTTTHHRFTEAAAPRARHHAGPFAPLGRPRGSRRPDRGPRPGSALAPVHTCSGASAGQLRHHPLRRTATGGRVSAPADRRGRSASLQGRTEGLDQRAGSKLRGHQRQAQQRHALPGDGGLNGAALVVEGDARLGVEPADAGSSAQTRQVGTLTFVPAGPHSKWMSVAPGRSSGSRRPICGLQTGAKLSVSSGSAVGRDRGRVHSGSPHRPRRHGDRPDRRRHAGADPSRDEVCGSWRRAAPAAWP